MHRFRRPFLLTLATLAILAGVASAVLWLGARTSFARERVAGVVSRALGLPATLEALWVGLLPSPSVVLEGLSVAQPDGFGSEPFLTVGHARIALPWSSLVGATRVDAVALADVTVRLVVRADGVANWSQLGGRRPGDAAAEPSSPGVAGWSLGALALERGLVDYRDAAGGARWQLPAIAVSAQGIAADAAFPAEIRLGGVFGENTAHFAVKGTVRLDPAARRYEATRLDFRGWLGGAPLPLAGVELTGALARAVYDGGRAALALDAGRFTLAGVPATFDGRVDLAAQAPAATLRLATEPFAPRPPAVAFGSPLPATADPAAFETLQLALTATLDAGVLTLDPVTGRLDDTNFEGRAVPQQALLRARLDRIDLDRYLPAAAKTASQKKQTLEEALAGLGELDFDAEIRIDEATLAGARIRDAVLRVEPAP